MNGILWRPQVVRRVQCAHQNSLDCTVVLARRGWNRSRASFLEGAYDSQRPWVMRGGTVHPNHEAPLFAGAENASMRCYRRSCLALVEWRLKSLLPYLWAAFKKASHFFTAFNSTSRKQRSRHFPRTFRCCSADCFSSQTLSFVGAMTASICLLHHLPFMIADHIFT